MAGVPTRGLKVRATCPATAQIASRCRLGRGWFILKGVGPSSRIFSLLCRLPILRAVPFSALLAWYNAVPSVLWSALNLAPLSVFCCQHVARPWLYGFVVASLVRTTHQYKRFHWVMLVFFLLVGG